MKKRKMKSAKEREKDIERVRINFGNRTRYRPEKDDVPVADRGHSNKPFRPVGLDDYEDLDEPPSFESKDGW
jgi:hypothetical protein